MGDSPLENALGCTAILAGIILFPYAVGSCIGYITIKGWRELWEDRENITISAKNPQYLIDTQQSSLTSRVPESRTKQQLENVIDSEKVIKRSQRLEENQSLEENVERFKQYIQENKQLIGNFDDYEIILPRRIGNENKYEMAFISTIAFYTFQSSDEGRTWSSLPPSDIFFRKLADKYIEETQKRGGLRSQDIHNLLFSQNESEEHTKTPQVAFEVEDRNSKLEKASDLEVQLSRNKSELEIQIIKENPEEIIVEDFSVGREEYLKRYRGKRSEAMFFTNNNGETWEGKRFYSRSGECLKILGHSFVSDDKNVLMKIHLSNNAQYESFDRGKTWQFTGSAKLKGENKNELDN